MKKGKALTTLPGLSKNALTVLEKRYLRRGPDGTTLETAADMFRRLATMSTWLCQTLTTRCDAGHHQPSTASWASTPTSRRSSSDRKSPQDGRRCRPTSTIPRPSR